MSPSERAAEIAQLDQQIRRLQKRVRALVAVMGGDWHLRGRIESIR
jgi:methylmalonyl-CoA mutase cobalamin-binding subunit